MLPAYDATLAYLQTRYLTLDQVAAASGVDAVRLQVLIDAGCLPRHSHEAVLGLVVETLINGSHPTAEHRVRYYHRDVGELAPEADQLARDLGLAGAARALRDRHDVTVAQASGLEPGSPAHRDLADETWGYWLDGTYGVCLQRVATADMIRKYAAVQRLEAALTAAKASQPIDLGALDAALAEYAAVSGPFGPQERDGSTRARLYEPALALRRTLQATAA